MLESVCSAVSPINKIVVWAFCLQLTARLKRLLMFLPQTGKFPRTIDKDQKATFPISVHTFSEAPFNMRLPLQIYVNTSPASHVLYEILRNEFGTRSGDGQAVNKYISSYTSIDYQLTLVYEMLFKFLWLSNVKVKAASPIVNLCKKMCIQELRIWFTLSNFCHFNSVKSIASINHLALKRTVYWWINNDITAFPCNLRLDTATANAVFVNTYSSHVLWQMWLSSKLLKFAWCANYHALTSYASWWVVIKRPSKSCILTFSDDIISGAKSHITQINQAWTSRISRLSNHYLTIVDGSWTRWFTFWVK